MKKYIIYPVLLLLVSIAGCSKLKETPYSSIYTDNFYKTASDAEAALVSAYSPLADLGSGPALTLCGDFSADQVYPRPVVGRNTLTLFNYDPNYTTQKSYSRLFESPQQIWQSCYSGIENSNWVILKVPATNMDAGRKGQILAEAYFLRAFYHWFLTKNFNQVVVKTTPSTDLSVAFVGKSPAADVYKQVYSDLDKAIAGLPDYSTTIVKGRPSKQVAQALYAKAALYSQDWPTALSMAQAVLASGKYSLMANVLDVYDVSRKDAARAENMWAFESDRTTPGRSGQIMGLYGPKNSDGPAYGKQTFGSIFAYPLFFASFSPADKRRQLLDTQYVNNSAQVVKQKDVTPITPYGVLVKKYMDPNSIGGASASNIPILRLADVYLIAAEAEARQNGATGVAYGYINTIRTRAGLPGLTAGLGKDAFVDSVLKERSWEFFAEGDRWYDLTRTNTFMQVIPAAVNDVYPVRTPAAKHRYFPIPQDEINANPKLTQNEGWQ
jgi:hypothetical protein